MTDTNQTMPPTPEKLLYKSYTKFCNVTTPKGHTLHFKGGMFITDNPDYISWLDAEIAANGFGGNIYIDPNARTISAEQENPMKALEKMFYEKFRAEQAAAINPANNMGQSTQEALRPASTSDIAAVTAGGDAGARLIPLNSALAALAASK